MGHHFLEFFDVQNFRWTMQHRVTVGTNGPKIFHRVDDIALANLCERHKVVNMDEPSSKLAVEDCEIETTDKANGAIVLDAGLSGARITLIGIHGDSPARTLVVERGC